MKFFTLVTALAVVVPSVFGLTINTPGSVVVCEPTEFNWSGGSSPYYFTLVPGGQPTAPPTKQFPTQNGNSLTWIVDVGAGTSLTAVLKDGSGNIAYSDIFTVQPGTSSSCVNATVQESGTGGSVAAPTGGSASTAAGAGSTTTSGSPASSATTTASSSTHSSAAGRLGVSSAFGVAGVMGLVGAALF